MKGKWGKERQKSRNLKREAYGWVCVLEYDCPTASGVSHQNQRPTPFGAIFAATGRAR